jgi:hypothetical protein
MKLAGFNLNKINIERLSSRPKEFKINANVDIVDIKELKPDFKAQEEFLAVKFTYNIDYSPDYVKIEFAGEVLLSLEPRLFREVIKQWKDKKLPDEFRIPLFNLILRKADIKAIELEDDLSLPVHISLPTIRAEKKSTNESLEEKK